MDTSSAAAAVLLDVLVTAISSLSGSLVVRDACWVPGRALRRAPGSQTTCTTSCSPMATGALRAEAGDLVWVPPGMVVVLDRDGIQVCNDVLREAGRRQLLGPTIPRCGWLLSAGVSVGSEPAGAWTKPAPSGRSAPARAGWAPSSCATPSSDEDPTTRSSGTAAGCCAPSPSRAKPCPQPSCGLDFFAATMTARTVTDRWGATARSVASLAPRPVVFLVITCSDPTCWTTRRTVPGWSTGPGCHRRAPLRAPARWTSRERWCGCGGAASG